MTRVGVDVGGTFTDLVAVVDGELVTAKVPSTARDQSTGVITALRASGVASDRIEAFAHGSTVATNALLERRGARTALVTTDGFRDVLEIGRQNRPSLYDLTQDRPPPLVPRELRFTVRERMGPDGELEPLEPATLEAALAGLREAGVEAVAVCLLFSFLHPAHERKVGDALRRALPDVSVSLSSEVLPEFREYERFATTAADAYLRPVLGAYLDRLAARLGEEGIDDALVMQSSGGAIALTEAARRAAALVLSGPAGGVVGAAHVAGASGYEDVLTFDMGGTSTDVAPVVGGTAATTTDALVAGVPLKFPLVDVHSVGAGGGSLAWVDEGGALRVGPRSAGADPGPAAYGRGGEEATVTDADLVLGYLGDGARLGGEIVLRAGLARAAVERVASRLGTDAVEAARGIVRVADEEMVRALRVISVERGLDPREFALVAFGGAGPMHACAVAEELGMRTVLVPKASGVLSALGLAVADVRRDYVSPFPAAVGDVRAGELEQAFAALERRAREELGPAETVRRGDLRYRGQGFELTVDGGGAEELERAFHAAHERRYGYRMEDEPVELVSLRLIASVPVEKPELGEERARGKAESGRRRARFDGGWAEAPVLDRKRMGAGFEVEGPAIVEFADATCVVRPAWRGDVDVAGTLVLHFA